MNKTRIVWHSPMTRLLVSGTFALAPLGVAGAWQAATQPATQPVIRPVPPSVQFQQDAQQNKLRDDLQKSQLQQQLRQGVSDVAGRPTQDDARAREQRQKAQQAQRDRDRAAQQDLLDRQRAAGLPRVVPQELPRELSKPRPQED